MHGLAMGRLEIKTLHTQSEGNSCVINYCPLYVDDTIVLFSHIYGLLWSSYLL